MRRRGFLRHRPRPGSLFHGSIGSYTPACLDAASRRRASPCWCGRGKASRPAMGEGRSCARIKSAPSAKGLKMGGCASRATAPSCPPVGTVSSLPPERVETPAIDSVGKGWLRRPASRTGPLPTLPDLGHGHLAGFSKTSHVWSRGHGTGIWTCRASKRTRGPARP